MDTLCAGQKAHYDLHRNILRMRSELFVQEEKMAFDFGQGELTQAELGDASVHPFWKEKKQTEDRAMKDGKPNETEKTIAQLSSDERKASACCLEENGLDADRIDK